MEKGIVYTLEVLFAAAIITISLVYIFRFSQTLPQYDIQLIKKQGIDTLYFMDKNYDLRKWVSDYNTEQIRSALNELMPQSVSFDVAVCQDECISQQTPGTKSVITVDYYVGAYRDKFVGAKVRLWMWR
jgi:hypothetical protein